MYQKSTLFIVNDLELALGNIIASLPLHSYRIIRNEDGKSEFQLLEAQKTIKEAYIATSTTKYICLLGDSFRTEAQNSLLKILEEPPKNVVFLLITLSKNSILPTILSRVQVEYQKTKKNIQKLDIDITKINLKGLYLFLKEYQRITKVEAKLFVESLLFTIHQDNIKLSEKKLQNFSNAMKLLELNSRPINVLTALLIELSDQ